MGQLRVKIFADGDKLPPTWHEWLKIAEEMEQGLKAYGHVVLRVPIDPATFPDWCAEHDVAPGSAGRRGNGIGLQAAAQKQKSAKRSRSDAIFYQEFFQIPESFPEPPFAPCRQNDDGR